MFRLKVSASNQYQMEYDSLIQDLVKHKMACQNLMGSSTEEETRRKFQNLAEEISNLVVKLEKTNIKDTDK